MKTVDQVRERIAELLWNGLRSENVSRYRSLQTVPELLSAMVQGAENTWYWPDIDYEQMDRASWKAMEHYARMILILQMTGPEKTAADPVLQEKMIGALHFWCRHDFQNPNWWHNEIGTPRNIGDIAIMLYPMMKPEEIAETAQIVGHGSMAVIPDRIRKWTGANLIWGMTGTIRHAVLTGNDELLRQAVERAAEEIRYDQEGLQTDGSFFQHGPRLYSGGYGRSFAFEMAQLFYILQGTDLQFAEAKMQLFLVHILDGLRHMTQGAGLDICCLGREYSRKDAVKPGILRRAVELLTQTKEMPRKEELKAYLYEMDHAEDIGGEQGPKPFCAIKLFDQAQLLTCHIPGLYVGAKFHDHRLWDAEICNREGELQYNMSYGTHTCIMRDGKEYLNIDPVWDFSCVPGTTARAETDAEILAHRDWWQLPLPNEETIGMQKEGRAWISEHAVHDGIDVYVTDFAFEGGFVSLGCGIRDEKQQLLHTTVDQCLCRGEVNVREDGREVLHHGIRYTSLDEHELNVCTCLAEGAWTRNNMSSDPEPVQEEVVRITIEHDTKNSSPESYAYLISPQSDPVPQVRVLSNTPDCQAIELPDGTILAAERKNN